MGKYYQYAYLSNTYCTLMGYSQVPSDSRDAFKAPSRTLKAAELVLIASWPAPLCKRSKQLLRAPLPEIRSVTPQGHSLSSVDKG